MPQDFKYKIFGGERAFMNKRAEFEKILQSTVIDNSLPTDSAREAIIRLQQWILGNLPKQLYRFRSNTDYTISALRKDQIWGSNIWEFNDPYECVPFCDFAKLQQTLDEEMSFDHVENVIKILKSGEIPENVVRVFGKSAIDHLIHEVPDTYNPERFRQACEGIKRQIIQNASANLDKLNSDFFEGILLEESRRYIACFCEENDSSLMWGHYANGHRGLCLEYDFSEIIKPCTLECQQSHQCNNLLLSPTIAPVIYKTTRLDATAHMLTLLQMMIQENQQMVPRGIYQRDTLLIAKCLLTKSNDWAYEKEWRIFSPCFSNLKSNHEVILHAKPKAVYLGARTVSKFDDEVVGICSEKGVPCYKMVQNFSGDSFTVIPFPYTEYKRVSKVT